MQEKKLNKAVSDVKLMKTPEGKTEVKNAVIALQHNIAVELTCYLNKFCDWIVVSF